MIRTLKHWRSMILLIPLMLTVICLGAALYMPEKYIQAQMPSPMREPFIGEYSYDGENWMPIDSDSNLSARNDVLYLRGHLALALPDGDYLYVYKNHIGLSVRINGQVWYSDIVAHLVSGQNFKNSPSLCGRYWENIRSPGISREDELEIRLYNPHSYGNESAYRDFLDTVCIISAGGEDILKRNLSPYSRFFRLVGQSLIAVAVLLLGISLTTLFLAGKRKTGYLFVATLTTMFAGIFVLFNTVDMSFWSSRIVFNTYMEQLSRIMSVFCCGVLFCFHLNGWRSTVAHAVMAVSALVNCGCFMASVFSFCVIFDTLSVWAISQLLICSLMIGLCVAELLCTSCQKRVILCAFALLFIAVLLDMASVGQTVITDNIVFKVSFVILMAVHLIYGVVSAWENNQRVFRQNRQLEQKLEDSRIAIMLSQIKPHFLYNVLNSIYHLYRKEPETAQEAVSTFAEYLRCNMLSIEKTELIHFSEEYQHIKAYLSLEQIRFGDEVNVVYDIQTANFRLPPLTVQPLVENAVKHGLNKKRGGGTVTISTAATEDSFVITIADDGRGFDLLHYIDDGLPHIGINNVRQRLQHMVGGMLEITSSGEGTTAVVTLPRKEAGLYHEDHRS